MWILLRGVRALSAPAFSPTLYFDFLFMCCFVGAAVNQQSEVSPLEVCFYMYLFPSR